MHPIKMIKRTSIILIFFIFVDLHLVQAEKLTFKQVYLENSDTILEPLPLITSWFDDQHYLEEKEGKIIKVNAVTNGQEICFDPKLYDSLKELRLDLINLGDKTSDYEKCVFSQGDHLYLFIKKNGSVTEFGKTDAKSQNPRFSPDGKYIGFTSDGNLYVFDIEKKYLLPLTFDGNQVVLNGYASWIYYEEILGRDSHYQAFWWSPDSKRIAFMRFDQEKVPVFTLVDADGDYGKVKRQYFPKPGYPNPDVAIGIADIQHKTIDWIEREKKEDHYISFLDWGKNSNDIYFQWMNRGQDFLRIYAYDGVQKKNRLIYEERQKHWIEFLADGDYRVLKNGDMVILSSKNGWYHLYHVARNGKEKQITGGNWSVQEITFVNENEKQVYFLASIGDSTENGLYRVSFNGKGQKRLTFFIGNHDIVPSLQGTYFLDTFSSLRVPFRMEIRDKRGLHIRKLSDQLSSKLEALDLANVELFRVNTTDGFKLPVIWYLPPFFDQEKKYPVIIKVYGGPGVSIVKNSFDRRLRNNFLAQQGIVVLIMDHRGSGHFGKKGMDLMHRNLGKWELFDCIEVVKYLKTFPFIDEKRIGITGGSYGGYVTALALSFAPDYFSCGIADFSVMDWKLYDSVYTERYMDMPAENPEGYTKSSVLNYLDNYRGGLRITHGSMDDNVHMQNTLQFLYGALTKGKKVELMIYPGEEHGYSKKMNNEYYRAALDFWMRHFFKR